MHYTPLLLKFRFRPVLPRDMHFKEVMSMRTKNQLKGGSDSVNKAQCVQELSAMVSCMKRTDFDEAPCSKEIAVFQECVAREAKAYRELRAALQEGAVAPDAVRLSYKQLNKLFLQWPVPGATARRSWVLPNHKKYADVPYPGE